MSVDPVAARDSGDNFNRYAYAFNNPYKFTDPDGRDGSQFYTNPEFHMAAPNLTPDEAATVLMVQAALLLGPVAPEAVGMLRTAVSLFRDKGPEVSKATAPYKRPSNATTRAQRASVQGKPCVKCGAETPKQVAGHKEALVKEYHQTGKIDKEKMQDVRSVQPECPTCSAKEGAEMSRYSREMNKTLERPIQ